MKKTIGKLLTVFSILILVSCGLESRDWEDDDAGTDDIPEVVSQDGGDSGDPNPWETEGDDGDSGDDNDNPGGESGGSGEEVGGGEDEGGSGNEGSGSGSTPGGGSPSGDDGGGSSGGDDGGGGSAPSDEPAVKKVAFKLSAKDAALQRTYIKSQGTLGSGTSWSISAEIEKKKGSVQSYYGITFLGDGKDNGSLAACLISSDGRVLIGKLINGSWTESRKITDCQFLVRGLNNKNRMKISCDGNGRYTLQINGNAVWTSSAADTANLTGSVWGIIAICNASKTEESIAYEITEGN